MWDDHTLPRELHGYLLSALKSAKAAIRPTVSPNPTSWVTGESLRAKNNITKSHCEFLICLMVDHERTSRGLLPWIVWLQLQRCPFSHSGGENQWLWWWTFLLFTELKVVRAICTCAWWLVMVWLCAVSWIYYTCTHTHTHTHCHCIFTSSIRVSLNDTEIRFLS